MENPKIFIIGIRKNITPDITASIATKLISASKNSQNSGIIICSSKSKIILSASRFQESSQFPIFRSEVLAENPDNFPINKKLHNSEKLDDNFYTKLQEKLWLNFEKLSDYYKCIFLFLESKFVEMHFKKYDLILQHEYQSAKIYTYNFIKKVRLKLRNEEACKSQEVLLFAIKNAIKNFLKENSQELIEILEEFRKKFDFIVNKAKELSNLLVKKKRICEKEKEQARKLSTKVSSIKTKFNSLKDNIDKVKNNVELLYPPISEDLDPFNLISSLTLQVNDDWEIKLNNSTPNYYCQLEIWCIETQSKICEFAIIEPYSKIKKTIQINMPESQIFFKNLIAKIGDKIISNAYIITPIFIDTIENIEKNCYEFRIINKSKIMKFSHLQIACDKIVDAFEVENSKIGYEEFSSAEVKFDKLPKLASFVVLDGRTIVSNLTEVPFKDGEESDDEEDIE